MRRGPHALRFIQARQSDRNERGLLAHAGRARALTTSPRPGQSDDTSDRARRPSVGRWPHRPRGWTAGRPFDCGSIEWRVERESPAFDPEDSEATLRAPSQLQRRIIAEISDHQLRSPHPPLHRCHERVFAGHGCHVAQRGCVVHEMLDHLETQDQVDVRGSTSRWISRTLSVAQGTRARATSSAASATSTPASS